MKPPLEMTQEGVSEFIFSLYENMKRKTLLYMTPYVNVPIFVFVCGHSLLR